MQDALELRNQFQIVHYGTFGKKRASLQPCKQMYINQNHQYIAL